jgi:ACR3 family arsenite efflux pump ArsB
LFFLVWSFLVWLGATAVFRFFGQFFFSLEQPLLLVATYVGVIPMILSLTFPVYRYKKLERGERQKAAVFIALPGMLFDVVVLLFFANIFVNVDPEMDRFLHHGCCGPTQRFSLQGWSQGKGTLLDRQKRLV